GRLAATGTIDHAGATVPAPGSIATPREPTASNPRARPPPLQSGRDPVPAPAARRPGRAVPRCRHRAAPAGRTARLRRRPVPDPPAQRLPPRHLPLVLGRAADPVVVAGPAHGVPHRRGA